MLRREATTNRRRRGRTLPSSPVVARSDRTPLLILLLQVQPAGMTTRICPLQAESSPVLAALLRRMLLRMHHQLHPNAVHPRAARTSDVSPVQDPRAGPGSSAAAQRKPQPQPPLPYEVPAVPSTSVPAAAVPSTVSPVKVPAGFRSCLPSRPPPRVLALHFPLGAALQVVVPVWDVRMAAPVFAATPAVLSGLLSLLFLQREEVVDSNASSSNCRPLPLWAALRICSRRALRPKLTASAPTPTPPTTPTPEQ
mmetsp:Transcript_11836/g.24996  ORF Transcript_11836/g.24996 Transcript_11836/m.24996 type:complete len:253 (+) Transcript_11836:722-1480(+)